MAGRTADATKFYHIAQTEFGGTNLRLAQILASWEARHGHPAEAQHILATMAGDAPEMAIALPGLNATTMTPPVPQRVGRHRRGVPGPRGDPAAAGLRAISP